MKTLVAVPCMDMVQALFMRSLLCMETVGQVEFSLAIGSLIYDARNQLATKAMNEDFDAVLWLDSDMIFEKDLMKRMVARVEEGAEYVSGLYFTRKSPFEPVIYSQVGMDKDTPSRIPYMDYPKDSVFQIAGSGMGAVMVTTDLLKRVTNKYGLPFSPILGFGEDLSFCLRVMEIGVPMFCDSSIKCGHIGFISVTENTFEKTRRK